MSDGIKETGWFSPDELDEEDRKEIGLDREELGLMQQRIEKPELGDPHLFFLPVRKRGRGGAR